MGTGRFDEGMNQAGLGVAGLSSSKRGINEAEGSNLEVVVIQAVYAVVAAVLDEPGAADTLRQISRMVVWRRRGVKKILSERNQRLQLIPEAPDGTRSWWRRRWVEEVTLGQPANPRGPIHNSPKHALSRVFLMSRSKGDPESATKRGSHCHTDLKWTSLESPIGGSCSLACLTFPPGLDLRPPDPLYFIPAHQSAKYDRVEMPCCGLVECSGRFVVFVIVVVEVDNKTGLQRSFSSTSLTSPFCSLELSVIKAQRYRSPCDSRLEFTSASESVSCQLDQFSHTMTTFNHTRRVLLGSAERQDAPLKDETVPHCSFLRVEGCVEPEAILFYLRLFSFPFPCTSGSG
ncbi:hypothetical protein Tco_1294788 [Tanacetum coccineum]